jgi:hypothetical protein
VSDGPQRVARVFTDTAWHPERRRVKYFPVARTRDAAGQDVIVDNTAWVGDYPILWSRREGNERLIVMLIDMEKGTTGHGRLSEEDFAKLPETDVEW